MIPSRRKAIKTIAASATLLHTTPLFSNETGHTEKLKGNINHSVCRWCFEDIPLDSFCTIVKEMGFNAIDLIKPSEFEIIQKHQIVCSMVSPEGLNDYLRIGWNNVSNHEKFVPFYIDLIEKAAKNGYKNVICFSGNRNGMSDYQGMINCALGLKKIMPVAEKLGVVVQMELFNSKIDHKDYQCDSSRWGAALCEMIQSPNFKLLYDIYHMQIQEGDVIRSIQQYHSYFGHYHTAGVPGRNEIDETQELYYPAIMSAIAATGYKGYVAQEFIPKAKDKLISLKKAIQICDI